MLYFRDLDHFPNKKPLQEVTEALLDIFTTHTPSLTNLFFNRTEQVTDDEELLRAVAKRVVTPNSTILTTPLHVPYFAEADPSAKFHIFDISPVQLQFAIFDRKILTNEVVKRT